MRLSLTSPPRNDNHEPFYAPIISRVSILPARKYQGLAIAFLFRIHRNNNTAPTTPKYFLQ
ncbi:MAG: hypothetical protein F6K40_09490 [Okeania sp. SIO3I5]|uniref:hypothetical protein n=1 Tax=Okeania sp. SIO3I5 TaxID=2607805 RepID=UPI0013B5EDD9|nr:hypothetical protein [Okeania sp. SIO3I5]NEQ36496.1 hypothetical protein [Okeania sp. SIO3I5]